MPKSSIDKSSWLIDYDQGTPWTGVISYKFLTHLPLYYSGDSTGIFFEPAGNVVKYSSSIFSEPSVEEQALFLKAAASVSYVSKAVFLADTGNADINFGALTLPAGTIGSAPGYSYRPSVGLSGDPELYEKKGDFWIAGQYRVGVPGLVNRPVAKSGSWGFPLAAKSDSPFGCRGFALNG